MLFVHEFIEYGDGSVHDNGWWEYDPDTEAVYNRNGGYHYLHHHPCHQMKINFTKQIFESNVGFHWQ